MKLKKYENNPILSPMAGHDWENLAVCNPGMWYEEGVFNLLYRAAGDDEEHRIYFGLAKSKDGFHFERVSDQPNVAPLEGNYDAGCIEDPRIIKFEDTYYITYAYRPFAPGRYWTFGHDEVLVPDVPQGAPDYVKKNTANTGLLMTKDLKNYQRLGRITKTFLDDRDVIIFPEKINGKYVMIHRPKEWIGDEYDCEFPGIWISYSDSIMDWPDGELLIKGEEDWEKKIGGSTPPLRTEKGWLTLYHGVDDAGIYRVGVMLLDLENPSRIIARSKNFIMEPEHDYETKGMYNGCVFPTGNTIVDGTLYVYYGGADKYCCVATCNVDELLAYLSYCENL